MDSPPHPLVQPLPPSTPRKALRSRPRLSNRPAKTHNCKRCLFGRPNRGEVSGWLTKELQNLNLEQQRRWNFDFSTMTPLAGGDWKWEKVLPPPGLATTTSRTSIISSSFPPLASPLEGRAASFLLPDVPPFGATRPPSITIDDDDDDDIRPLGDDIDDDDDVFIDQTNGKSPAKRARMTTDFNDENANPICFTSSSPPPARLPSPLFGRGSAARALSESSDASADENTAPSEAVAAPPLLASPASSTKTTTTSSLMSPVKTTTSLMSPVKSTTSLMSPVKTTAFFRDPSTPSRATLGDLASPPPRLTRAVARTRDSTAPASSKSRAGGATQTRLGEFFAVKRRSLESIAGGGGAVAASPSAAKLGKLRKRIDFNS